MTLTEGGMITEVKEEQFLKAEARIVVTEEGILTREA